MPDALLRSEVDGCRWPTARPFCRSLCRDCRDRSQTSTEVDETPDEKQMATDAHLPPVAIPPSIYEPEGDVVTQPNGRLIRAVEQEDGSIVVYVKPYQGQGEVPELILSVVGGTDDPAYCSECVGPCRTPYCAACGDEPFRSNAEKMAALRRVLGMEDFS